MEFSAEEKRAAMATARSAGAVSKNAIVPKVVRKLVHPGEDWILDYGCGAAKRHVSELLQEGYIVEGYDFSLPHTKPCLNAIYDVVYLSNVLNVQSSLTMLDLTLREVRNIIGKKFTSKLVVNYPSDPRKLGISTKAMETILNTYFGYVYRCPKTEVGNNVVWICQWAKYI